MMQCSSVTLNVIDFRFFFELKYHTIYMYKYLPIAIDNIIFITSDLDNTF